MPELVVDIEEGLFEDTQEKPSGSQPKKDRLAMGRVRQNLGFRRCPKKFPRLSDTGGRTRGQMFERNSNTDRVTIFGQFQRKDGEKKCKQKGKRNPTLN
eukprot:15332192-Heterocapsa_arctica.AAC.1